VCCPAFLLAIPFLFPDLNIPDILLPLLPAKIYLTACGLLQLVYLSLRFTNKIVVNKLRI